MDTPVSCWIMPACPPILADHEVHIWRASLTADQATVQHYKACLSATEQARAARLVFAADRNRFVIARGMLRQLLAMYLQVQLTTIEFGYSTYGKPFLATPASKRQLEFNLAHSGDHALYAFAWQRRLGIDLEHIRYDLEYPTLLPGVFTEYEQRVLAALPADQQRNSFFRGWVCKEAYLKARGEGLAYAPDLFEVHIPVGQPAKLHLPLETPISAWLLQELAPAAGYAAAVVAEGNIAKIHCFTLA
jgi:4'-phosphopantetheinyl transferase